MAYRYTDSFSSATSAGVPDLLPLVFGAALTLAVTCIWCFVNFHANRPAPQRRTVNQPERRRRTPKTLNWDEIGVRYNKWRKPVALFGPSEGEMKNQLCRELDLDDFDISSEDWNKRTYVFDRVIGMLFSEISKEASPYNLKIQEFVRQGSAREGLKVCVADEFDVLLQFSIEGLEFEVQPEVDESGRNLPEIGKLRVRYPSHQLELRYPKLYSAKTFSIQQGQIYLNSRMLHEKVFTAIIDKARGSVSRILDSDNAYSFRIRRAINQPAVKITVEFNIHNPDVDLRHRVGTAYDNYRSLQVVPESAAVNLNVLLIDIDLVPALLIRHDKVPDPTKFGEFMDCPRYAVFKWVRDNHPFTLSYGVNPETIWRMDSSGYEKHVLDVAQGTAEQRYILTAQRVLKAYFLYENRKSLASPPQIVTVLRSYFLKQVAFYCILYCTVLNKIPLSGDKEALTILLNILEVCLEERRLPHFFHTNPWLGYMFPDYDMGANALRYDVFHTVRLDALRQAKLDIRRRVMPKLRHFTCDLTPLACAVKDKFREFIAEGDYL